MENEDDKKITIRMPLKMQQDILSFMHQNDLGDNISEFIRDCLKERVYGEYSTLDLNNLFKQDLKALDEIIEKFEKLKKISKLQLELDEMEAQIKKNHKKIKNKQEEVLEQIDTAETQNTKNRTL